MNNYKNIAVLDIGKTNIKLLLIDVETSKHIMVLARPNRVVETGMYPHLDVDETWEFILNGLKSFGEQYGVDAISITTHGATAVLMNGDELALPVLDYESNLPEETRKDYNAIRGDFSETFSPILPNGLNLAAQIYWQKQTFPSQFAKVTDILMYPQYWAWKLNGKKACEVTSLGVHTDLWNPVLKDFSKLVDNLNWRKLFPPMAKAVSVLGNISNQVAEHIKLDKTIPVACGIHDSNASLLPYIGELKNKFSIISSGTWVIVMSVGGDTDQLNEHRDCLANVDAFGNVVPTSRFMGGREYDILIENRKAEPKAKDLNYIIENNIFILPSYAGKVGPYPNLVGRWVGDKDNLSNEEYSAAVALYLAMMSCECLNLSGCGDLIIIEGPLAKNTIYASILSSLIDKPVYLSGDETGTSNGAVYLLNSNKNKRDLGENAMPIDEINVQAYFKEWLAHLN